MYRKLFSFALLMGAILLTGCLKSEGNENQGKEYVVTEGAYVVTTGDPSATRAGVLYYIDYNTGTVTPNFEVIGLSPSDVMVYGNKVYVIGCGSNTIYIFDKKSNRLVDKIFTIDELGEDAGFEPNSVAAYGSNVYVSTHGGYVAVIDTTSLTITNKFKVGSYPEGMGVGIVESNSTKEATLYVANSDNGNGNGSISKINLGTGNVSEIKNDLIKNPRKVVVGGTSAFVLDYGTKDAEGNQKGNGVYYVSDNNVSLVIDGATNMTAGGSSIVTYNYPAGSTNADYKVCNLYYNTVSSFYLNGDSSYPMTQPSAISVDPNTGYLLIGTSGYTNLYDGNGNFVKTFEIGDKPCSISYSYGKQVIK